MPTYTYDVTTNAGKVQLEVQDTTTSSTTRLLSDEEYAVLLADEGTVLGAAARAAEIISRKYAHDFNWTADGDSVDRMTRAKQWADLAATLRRRGGAGIVSRQTKNTDAYQPIGLERNHSDRDTLGID